MCAVVRCACMMGVRSVTNVRGSPVCVHEGSAERDKCARWVGGWAWWECEAGRMCAVVVWVCVRGVGGVTEVLAVAVVELVWVWGDGVVVCAEHRVGAVDARRRRG